MANEIQIDYTSRDFAALKNDLINLINARTQIDWDPADPSDLGNILVETFSYMGDIMSYYLDRVANETTVDTAIKRETLLNFAELYGYKPSGPTPATVSVLFENISTQALDIPIGTQVMAPLLFGPYTEIYFETTQAAIQLQPGQTITIPAKEGKTVNTDRPDLINPSNNKPLPSSLGTSNGDTNQEFLISDVGIVDASLIVYVGQGQAFAPWNYVDTLSNSGPTDLVFTTSQNEDGSLTVIFGDNINGAVPATGQLISALYKTSVGEAGNVVSNAISEVTFIPGNIDPEAISYLTATNPAVAFGGADADDNSQLRAKIKAAIISRKRAVTLDDYKYLALQVPQVGKINAVGAVYSSVTLYIQPQNDGTSTPGIVAGNPTTAWTSLASSVSSYMQDKVPVGTTVSTQPPVYVPLYVSLSVVVNPAYRNNTIKLNMVKAFLDDNQLFSFEQNSFGRTIAFSKVMATAAGIEGVESVTITKLNTDNGSGAATISLAASQIPYLVPDNLIITTTGGLS
jgi:uncharacterized phage protein gp47/JayE